MKSIIPLLGILIILVGCKQRSSYVSPQEELENNNMDFPNLDRQYFNGISYLLSDLFEFDYDDDYVVSSENNTYVIYDIDVNFSVESFDEYDAELIQYSFEDDISMLDAVHDNYIIKREESLLESTISIKKVLPESVGFEGYMQVVNGNTYSYDPNTAYFTATIKVDDMFYVFQLIGKQDNMGYLYDDFIDLLSSIEK